MDFNTWQQLLDRIIQEPINERLAQAMDAGNMPVGYTCSYVPRVMLSLPGLIPVRVRATSGGGTEIADIYLSQVTCSYSRTILENALDHQYDHLAGWVFAAGCDHIRRLLDNLDYLIKPAFIHMVDAPHRRGEAAFQWFRQELELLANRLAGQFGVDTSPPALKRAIQTENRFYRHLHAIAAMRKEKPPPLTGTEFQRIMVASLVTSRDRLADELEGMADQMASRTLKNGYRARLMLLGGNVDDIEFISAIEATGGLIVADRFCTGSLPGMANIPETDDPLSEIARHTLDHVACPRMMDDFEKRLADILRLKNEYRVDGIIVENIKFCDLWGIETSLLTKALKAAGVSVLRLERDYRLTGEGQLRTRVQAFLESMGK